MAETSNSRCPPLVVVVNGEPQLEYDRSRTLSQPQLADLGRMDRKMDSGIRLGLDWIARPQAEQRARFVAIQLVEALQRDDHALIAACCSYLAHRLPDLKQIKARLAEAGFAVELVFDKPYVKEVPLSFVPRP
ncbi:MAG: hypothetical protein PVI91_01885 [Gammaproteobacteria bacterium]